MADNSHGMQVLFFLVGLAIVKFPSMKIKLYNWRVQKTILSWKDDFMHEPYKIHNFDDLEYNYYIMHTWRVLSASAHNLVAYNW